MIFTTPLRRGLAGLLATLTLLTPGCGDDTGTVAMVPSSLTGVTEPVDDALGTETAWVIAGSSRLVRQLADGARADVLITADAETMRDAVARGLVEGEPVVIAGNRLVVALAPGNPGRLDDLADLEDPTLLLGVCAAEVPCGRLAAEAETALSIDVAVDTEEPNVRALALKIETGELDAGLVYATDAADLGLETLRAAELDPFVTEYLAVAVHGSAHEIVDFLRSPAGRRLLSDDGFIVS
ncbi:MAG: substrate-binding domain-containing protein [Acidimicrobiales bacterium]